jgi:hypothetical protein
MSPLILPVIFVPHALRITPGENNSLYFPKQQ